MTEPIKLSEVLKGWACENQRPLPGLEPPDDGDPDDDLDYDGRMHRTGP